MQSEKEGLSVSFSSVSVLSEALLEKARSKLKCSTSLVSL
jgi:hypothetical protein